MLLCKFCGDEKKNKQSLSQHERLCTKNGGRVVSKGNAGKVGKNQYTKAKERGEKIIVSEETREKFRKASTGRKYGEDTKRKISEARIRFLNENPSQVPYRLYHSSKRSFPEIYFADCFSLLIGVEQEFPVGIYNLDFANVRDKIYLEIDGESHYDIPSVIEKDKKRKKYLEDLGWVEYRIRWVEFSKLDSNCRQEKIREIVKLMKWDR